MEAEQDRNLQRKTGKPFKTPSPGLSDLVKIRKPQVAGSIPVAGSRQSLLVPPPIQVL